MNGQLMLKRPKLFNCFQGRAFKEGNIKDVGCRVFDHLMDVLLIGWW